MADTQTTVVNLDIQLLDESRADTTTFKLDNPKSNVTREQVSSAMQPALTNGWLLTTKGNVAMYLGDITVNQSIKTKLGGEDFYVSPSEVNLQTDTASHITTTITVSGATIQGYNFKNFPTELDVQIYATAEVAENGLSITVDVNINYGDLPSGTTKLCDLILVIQGVEVVVPIKETIQ